MNLLLINGTYHYLRNEVEQLLDIIETIARLRDIRVFFLGNAISITNPYFLYFKLDLPYHSDIRTYKDNLILVNYIKNEEYRKVKKQTKFGKLIEGTEYGKYAIDNEFLRDSSTFIARRPNDSKFYFILKIDSNQYGVWIDYNCNSLYVSNQFDNSTSLKLAVNSDSHDNSTYLIQYRKNTYFQALINFYRLSHLYFESQQIKNITMDFLKNYLTY